MHNVFSAIQYFWFAACSYKNKSNVVIGLLWVPMCVMTLLRHCQCSCLTVVLKTPLLKILYLLFLWDWSS